jgi:diamine N-acetyltransferase
MRTLVPPECEKRGFAKEAKRILLEYAFLDLKLVKMCSELLEIHEATLHINQKLGLTHEGMLKDHVEINEIRYSLILMAIMRDDWLRMHDLYLL